ncbi:hypothetical protein AB0G32_29105, partial [Streptomyces sp. NPDC023723]
DFPPGRDGAEDRLRHLVLRAGIDLETFSQAAAASTRRRKSPRAALNASGRSRLGRCAAPSTTTRAASGSRP